MSKFIDKEKLDEIHSAVAKIGVKINKEELIKLLEGDRDAYSQGYKDAMKEKDVIPIKTVVNNDGLEVICNYCAEKNKEPCTCKDCNGDCGRCTRCKEARENMVRSWMEKMKQEELNKKLISHRGEDLRGANLCDAPNVTSFKQIAFDLCELYKSKNHDYGNAFGKTFKELGIISAVTRISDKFNRLVQLTKEEAQVKDESLLDTLKDLASYCIMTLVELEYEK